MSVKRGRIFLQTPGPTNIPERVLNAMHRSAVEFAGPEFGAFARKLLIDIKPLFRTEGTVFIYAANGHGAWDAALSNILSPGDKVLAPETGRFALSWADQARNLGIETEIVPNDWRRAIVPADLEARLRADPEHAIKAVLLVHTDTATGITCDIPAVRRAIDAAGHPALLVVDTIASLLTTEFEMDAWGVDVAVAACQKGLMMPPGLSFVAANDKAFAAHRDSTLPRGYWDWTDRLQDVGYKWFCGTAPEHLLFGLREAIDMINEEGFDAIFARHARLAAAVRAAIGVWSQAGALELAAREQSEQANSVSTILVDPAYDPVEIRTICRDRFDLALGNGLGQFEKNSFRIGHMGDLNAPMILGALAAVEAGLVVCGVPHGQGGVNAAIDVLAAD